MEIKCERCDQETGQIKKQQNKKLEVKDINASTVKKHIPRKKREDLFRRAKRPGNRTVYMEENSGRTALHEDSCKFFELLVQIADRILFGCL